MWCDKRAATEDLEHYKALCKKHGMEPKVTGPYSYDTEHGRFVNDLENGLSTIWAVKNSRLRQIAEKRVEIARLSNDKEYIDRDIKRLRAEIAKLVEEDS